MFGQPVFRRALSVWVLECRPFPVRAARTILRPGGFRTAGAGFSRCRRPSGPSSGAADSGSGDSLLCFLGGMFSVFTWRKGQGALGVPLRRALIPLAFR